MDRSVWPKAFTNGKGEQFDSAGLDQNYIPDNQPGAIVEDKRAINYLSLAHQNQYLASTYRYEANSETIIHQP